MINVITAVVTDMAQIVELSSMENYYLLWLSP